MTSKNGTVEERAPRRAEANHTQLFLTPVEVTVFRVILSKEAFIPCADPLDCSDWINMAPLAAHRSSFLTALMDHTGLNNGPFHH